MYELEDIQEENQEFVVNTDTKADWCLKKIQEERKEVERLTKIIKEMQGGYLCTGDTDKGMGNDI